MAEGAGVRCRLFRHLDGCVGRANLTESAINDFIPFTQSPLQRGLLGRLGKSMGL